MGSNNGVAFLLMIALFISGGALAFNLPAYFGIPLGLGFGDIAGFSSGIWIIIAKLTGLVLMAVSAFVAYGILTN